LEKLDTNTKKNRDQLRPINQSDNLALDLVKNLKNSQSKELVKTTNSQNKH